jgi:DNA-binding transcriptional LysR family regulator
VSAVRPLIQATLDLKARHPALELHVSAAKSMELIARVESGELDAAIAVRESTAAQRGLAWTALYGEPMVLLAPRATEVAPLRTLLQRHPFIRFDRSQHTGLLVERTLRKLKAKSREFLELNAIESMVELVRSGLGVTIVPLLRDARWQADARLRVIEIPQAEVRRIALVQRRESPNGAVVAALARQLKGS